MPDEAVGGETVEAEEAGAAAELKRSTVAKATDKNARFSDDSVSSELDLLREYLEPSLGELAKKITAYILDHQDDAAQEDHWRTKMQRKMSESFRAQREAIDRLNSRFDNVDMQLEAIDEVRQLVNDVKNLANLANANQPSYKV